MNYGHLKRPFVQDTIARGENAEIIIMIIIIIPRESYMSARVLLNLLNELGKRDKNEACRAFYHFFRNEFNKFTQVQTNRWWPFWRPSWLPLIGQNPFSKLG